MNGSGPQDLKAQLAQSTKLAHDLTLELELEKRARAALERQLAVERGLRESLEAQLGSERSVRESLEAELRTTRARLAAECNALMQQCYDEDELRHETPVEVVNDSDSEGVSEAPPEPQMSHEEIIRATFLRAVYYIQNGGAADQLCDTPEANSGKELSTSMQLAFYGLYKASTLGENTTPKPSFYNVVAVKKWESWAQHKSLSKTEAMSKYIDLLSENAPHWKTWKGLENCDVKDPHSSTNAPSHRRPHQPTPQPNTATTHARAKPQRPTASLPLTDNPQRVSTAGAACHRPAQHASNIPNQSRDASGEANHSRDASNNPNHARDASREANSASLTSFVQQSSSHSTTSNITESEDCPESTVSHGTQPSDLSEPAGHHSSTQGSDTSEDGSEASLPCVSADGDRLDAVASSSAPSHTEDEIATATFQRAVFYVQNGGAADQLANTPEATEGKQLSTSTQLAFYGLYKAATVGENTTTKPSFYNVVAVKKWESWYEHRSLSKIQAMNKYVELLTLNAPQWRSWKGLEKCDVKDLTQAPACPDAPVVQARPARPSRAASDDGARSAEDAGQSENEEDEDAVDCFAHSDDEIMAATFQRAVYYVQNGGAAAQLANSPEAKSGARLSTSVQLAFYGLYKAATVGENTTAKPSFYNVVAVKKWESWYEHRTLTKIQAMAKYVDLLTQCVPQWQTWTGLESCDIKDLRPQTVPRPKSRHRLSSKKTRQAAIASGSEQVRREEGDVSSASDRQDVGASTSRRELTADERFERAVFFIRNGGLGAQTVGEGKAGSLFDVPHDLLRSFYGLYKQATEGPCHESPPMMLNILAREKWKAWKRQGDKGPTEAKKDYVDLLTRNLPTWEQWPGLPPLPGRASDSSPTSSVEDPAGETGASVAQPAMSSSSASQQLSNPEAPLLNPSELVGAPEEQEHMWRAEQFDPLSVLPPLPPSLLPKSLTGSHLVLCWFAVMAVATTGYALWAMSAPSPAFALTASTAVWLSLAANAVLVVSVLLSWGLNSGVSSHDTTAILHQMAALRRHADEVSAANRTLRLQVHAAEIEKMKFTASLSKHELQFRLLRGDNELLRRQQFARLADTSAASLTVPRRTPRQPHRTQAVGLVSWAHEGFVFQFAHHTVHVKVVRLG